jgi:hypothetical protein
VYFVHDLVLDIANIWYFIDTRMANALIVPKYLASLFLSLFLYRRELTWAKLIVLSIEAVIDARARLYLKNENHGNSGN